MRIKWFDQQYLGKIKSNIYVYIFNEFMHGTDVSGITIYAVDSDIINSGYIYILLVHVTTCTEPEWSVQKLLTQILSCI